MHKEQIEKLEKLSGLSAIDAKKEPVESLTEDYFLKISKFFETLPTLKH